jgi:hypothetical protein
MKYAQCVKNMAIDVLVLFLKYVQFLKSYVQFLVDTILNLSIVQFLMKKKGDARHATRVSNLRRRETHPRNGRLISEEKGDTPTQLVSHISGMHISLLLNMHKKECLQNILQGMFLVPTSNMPVGTHT